jgi:rubrerythrin
MAQALAFETTIQEAIVKPVVNFAEKLRRALSISAEAHPEAALQQNYQAERGLAKQLHRHALLMPNDPFRHTLEQIAVETEHHAQLLAEQLRALETCLPAEDRQEAPEGQPVSTIWRLIAADIAAIGAISHRYRAQLGWISAPNVQRSLQDIRAAKHRHRQRLSDLLARTDSYAMPGIDDRASC